VEDGIEEVICETHTVVVHQIPMHLDDAVGRAAGNGLEQGAVGGVEFDDVTGVLLWQSGLKRRSHCGIEVRGC